MRKQPAYNFNINSPLDRELFADIVQLAKTDTLPTYLGTIEFSPEWHQRLIDAAAERTAANAHRYKDAATHAHKQTCKGGTKDTIGYPPEVILAKMLDAEAVALVEDEPVPEPDLTMPDGTKLEVKSSYVRSEDSFAVKEKHVQSCTADAFLLCQIQPQLGLFRVWCVSAEARFSWEERPPAYGSFSPWRRVACSPKKKAKALA